MGAASSVSSATEVARHGVTANVVVPGLVDTAMTLDMTAAQREKLVEPIPMAGPGTPEEVAEAVRFCARASPMTQELRHGGWWNCIRTL